MSLQFVFIFMLFCHVFDDYFLQAHGCLANLKQKKYWQDNAPEPIYKYDYVVALIMHSISWSFMIMLPIAIYLKFNIGLSFISFFIANAIAHTIVDDTKANAKKINLIADQIFHIIQIVYTFNILLLT